MIKRNGFSLTVSLSILTLVPQSYATAFDSLSSLEQVEEVAQWFRGDFNNAPQVANNPTVPLITMSNCSVAVTGGSFGTNIESIFLEQTFLTTPQPPRLRYYTFSPLTTGVLLSVRSFIDQTHLSGLCNLPESERTLEFSNINPLSCDIELSRLVEPVRYFGTNSPDGCPAASGSSVTVISTISIHPNQIDSFDQGFIGTIPIFGTPITFNRVPESSLVLGLVSLGIIGVTLKLSQ